MAATNYKSKSDLKDVFSGLSSLYIKKGGLGAFDGYTRASPLVWDYDMPVQVDTLSLQIAAPTLNHVKVHGMNADWAVTSTSGDATFECTVPSVDEELIGYFMGGKTAVSALYTLAAADDTGDKTKWAGNSFAMESQKLEIGIGLLDEAKEKLFLVKNISVYATPLFENASTTPFAFRLTGSIGRDAVCGMVKAGNTLLWDDGLVLSWDDGDSIDIKSDV